MSTRNALITGASSGIGAATALWFAQHGWRVWGTTRDLDRLPAQLQDIINFVEMDVTDDSSVESAVHGILVEVGQLDLLVNNAGVGIFGPVEEVSSELTRQQFEVNLFGLLRVTRAIIPHMRERKSGRIINVSSLAALLAIPYQSHYSATKAAVEIFTEGLRQELRPFGVTVTTVLPGDIRTNFNDQTQFPDSLWRENSPYHRWVKAAWQTIDTNMRKALPPEVVAQVIWRAATTRHPKARYVAGDFLSRQVPWILLLLPANAKERLVRQFYGIDAP
jgi:NAD(P)-dependent dehydrogenase (short-subunit alcohol dehydrogenase family)